METVGRSLPGVEVKIVDPESGAELGDNEQGELCSRGHVVMLGYYKDEEATRKAIDEDGWLHSGDLALRQPNGYYRITGRIKDMVFGVARTYILARSKSSCSPIRTSNRRRSWGCRTRNTVRNYVPGFV